MRNIIVFVAFTVDNNIRTVFVCFDEFEPINILLEFLLNFLKSKSLLFATFFDFFVYLFWIELFAVDCGSSDLRLLDWFKFESFDLSLWLVASSTLLVVLWIQWIDLTNRRLRVYHLLLL